MYGISCVDIEEHIFVNISGALDTEQYRISNKEYEIRKDDTRIILFLS